MPSLAEQAFEHVQQLAVNIGSRTIGSPGNLAAAEYILRIYQKSGLAVELQEFACPDWEEVVTSLSIGGESLESFANTFSPACDITAPLLPLGTLAELEEAALTGRILVFYGELAQHELAAKGAIYVPERDARIVQILEEHRPAGLITINPSQNGRWRLVEDFDLSIPSATVTAQTGLQLLQQPGKPVHLHIEIQRSPSHSANVAGHLPGEKPDKIVICAHYDTKVDTSGAYDNAAGVAALLSLVELLASKPHHYTLEFVAFSGEEIYGLGDMVYANKNEGCFGQIVAALNFDGIGPLVAANSMAIFAASAAFSELVDGKKAAFPGVAKVEPWPASDHYIFYSHGVPSLAFSSLGIKDIYHTPADTIDWISPGKLAEVIQLAFEIILAIDGKDMEWMRPS